MNKLSNLLAGSLGIGGAIVFVVIWLVAVLASLLVTVAVAAVAGDLLGLWEVVDFV